MTSDVVLSAALRNNLISLQNTQSAVDISQNRLATGKKINSALDGPQAFFASQALTNRASDLTRLLDSIGQSIQVIKAADNGVTALTKLVEQADAIAGQARDALAGGTSEAKVTGNVDLRGVDSLPDLSGITAGDTITFSLIDEDNVSRSIGAFGGAAAATASITLAANFSIDDLITAINDLTLEATVGSGTANGNQAFTASLDTSGHLQIAANDGAKYALRFGAAVTAATEPARLAVAQALGFGDVAKAQAADTAATDSIVGFTASNQVSLQSIALYDNSVPASRSIAQRGDLLSVLTNSAGAANLFTGIDNATDDYQIGINGGTLQNIELFAGGGVVSIQEFIDQINNNTNLNQSIRAVFDDATGVLSIEAVSKDVESVQVGLAASIVTAGNFGFGVNAGFASTAAIDESENIVLSSAAGTLAELEGEYNNVLSQIDELTKDTGYRGTNLLNGNDLLTVFNEGRSSTLTTSGVTYDSAGLGLSTANFTRESSVDGALDDVRAALESVRGFGTTLANDLSIIQTRETFTKDLVNTLQEGSDKLVNADQNEEGAKLLALQTRQSLGVTALSLASQSQQSILRLF